jgi:hypothetical protein
MTKIEAAAAMEAATLVEAGEGDDRDTGRIHQIDGDKALVGWQSGVSTWTQISDLSAA